MTIAQMQIRRGTAAQWTTANPVLADGEWGLETDTGKVKVGLASTAWNSLPYFPDYIQDQIDVLGPREALYLDTPGTFSGASGFEKGDWVWLKYIRVTVWGAGGGSGGVPAPGASNSSASDGGAGGGFAQGLIPASALGNQETYIVGAGGTAGAVTPGAGGNGGTSSFGTVPILTATGGGGSAAGPAGAAGTAFGTGAASTPGTGSSTLTEALLLTGDEGGPGYRISGVGTGGIGGCAPLGGGRVYPRSSNVVGGAGVTPGGGAAGAGVSTSGTAKTGAAGGNGAIYIELFG